jgi:hypothetical protein
VRNHGVRAEPFMLQKYSFFLANAEASYLGGKDLWVLLNYAATVFHA